MFVQLSGFARLWLRVFLTKGSLQGHPECANVCVSVSVCSLRNTDTCRHLVDNKKICPCVSSCVCLCFSAHVLDSVCVHVCVCVSFFY